MACLLTGHRDLTKQSHHGGAPRTDKPVARRRRRRRAADAAARPEETAISASFQPITKVTDRRSSLLSLAMLCTPNCCSVDGLAGSKRPAGRVGVYIATGAVGWGSWLADVLSAVLSTLPRLVLFVCLINNMWGSKSHRWRPCSKEAVALVRSFIME
jgi:hypothetical protein